MCCVCPQLLRQNDEQRARETRLGELDDAILDAEFQLAKRDIGIAAIEARVSFLSAALS